MEPENIRKFIIDARNGGQSDVNIQIYLTEKHGIENAASYFVEKKKSSLGSSGEGMAFMDSASGDSPSGGLSQGSDNTDNKRSLPNDDVPAESRLRKVQGVSAIGAGLGEVQEFIKGVDSQYTKGLKAKQDGGGLEPSVPSFGLGSQHLSSMMTDERGNPNPWHPTTTDIEGTSFGEKVLEGLNRATHLGYEGKSIGEVYREIENPYVEKVNSEYKFLLNEPQDSERNLFTFDEQGSLNVNFEELDNFNTIAIEQQKIVDAEMAKQSNTLDEWVGDSDFKQFIFDMGTGTMGIQNDAMSLYYNITGNMEAVEAIQYSNYIDGFRRTASLLNEGLTQDEIDKGIFDNFKEGNFNAGFSVLTTDVAQTTPQLILQAAMTAGAGWGTTLALQARMGSAFAASAQGVALRNSVGLWAGSAAMGATVMGRTLADEYGILSDSQRWTMAFGNAMVETLSERLFTGDMQTLLGRELKGLSKADIRSTLFQKGLFSGEMRQMAKHFVGNQTKAFARQGFEEGMEEVFAGIGSEMVASIVEGRDWKFNFSELADQFLVGFGAGAGTTVVSAARSPKLAQGIMASVGIVSENYIQITAAKGAAVEALKSARTEAEATVAQNRIDQLSAIESLAAREEFSAMDNYSDADLTEATQAYHDARNAAFELSKPNATQDQKNQSTLKGKRAVARLKEIKERNTGARAMAAAEKSAVAGFDYGDTGSIEITESTDSQGSKLVDGLVKISKALGGSKVFAHADYDAMAASTGIEKAELHGSRGIYKTEDGSIHVLLPAAMENTGLHEAFHAVARNVDPEFASKFVRAVLPSLSLLPEGVWQKYKGIISQYENNRPLLEEELFAEVQADIASGVITQGNAGTAIGHAVMSAVRNSLSGAMPFINIKKYPTFSEFADYTKRVGENLVSGAKISDVKRPEGLDRQDVTNRSFFAQFISPQDKYNFKSNVADLSSIKNFIKPVIQDLWDEVDGAWGYSINTETLEAPTAGYMVSDGRNEQKFLFKDKDGNIQGLPMEAIEKALENQRKGVGKQENAHFGGWIAVDQKTEETFLYMDISENTSDKTDALLRAFDRAELAIYDVANGEEIKTPESRPTPRKKLQLTDVSPSEHFSAPKAPLNASVIYENMGVPFMDLKQVVDSFVKENGRYPKMAFWMGDQSGYGEYVASNGKKIPLEGGIGHAVNPKNMEDGVVWANNKTQNEIDGTIKDADIVAIVSGHPIKSQRFYKGTSRVLGAEFEFAIRNSAGKEISLGGSSSIIIPKFAKDADIIDIVSGIVTLLQEQKKGGNKFADVLTTLSYFETWEDMIENANSDTHGMHRAGVIDGFLGDFEATAWQSNFFRAIGMPSEVELSMKTRDGYLIENNFQEGDVYLYYSVDRNTNGTVTTAPGEHSTYFNNILGTPYAISNAHDNLFEFAPETQHLAEKKASGHLKIYIAQQEQLKDKGGNLVVPMDVDVFSLSKAKIEEYVGKALSAVGYQFRKDPANFEELYRVVYDGKSRLLKGKAADMEKMRVLGSSATHLTGDAVLYGMSLGMNFTEKVDAVNGAFKRFQRDAIKDYEAIDMKAFLNQYYGGAVPTALSETKPAKAELRKSNPVIESIESGKFEITEDGKGNYVFFHYGEKEFDAVDPSFFGKNAYTSDKRSTPVSFFYTAKNRQEAMVSGTPNIVLVQKEQVYPLQTDPLRLYDEAKRRHDEYYAPQYQGLKKAFDAPAQATWVMEVAKERGYKMLISLWNGVTRGESPSALKVDKKATAEFLESGRERIYKDQELTLVKAGEARPQNGHVENAKGFFSQSTLFKAVSDMIAGGMTKTEIISKLTEDGFTKSDAEVIFAKGKGYRQGMRDGQMAGRKSKVAEYTQRRAGLRAKESDKAKAFRERAAEAFAENKRVNEVFIKQLVEFIKENTGMKLSLNQVMTLVRTMNTAQQSVFRKGKNDVDAQTAVYTAVVNRLVDVIDRQATRDQLAEEATAIKRVRSAQKKLADTLKRLPKGSRSPLVSYRNNILQLTSIDPAWLSATDVLELEAAIKALTQTSNMVTAKKVGDIFIVNKPYVDLLDAEGNSLGKVDSRRAKIFFSEVYIELQMKANDSEQAWLWDTANALAVKWSEDNPGLTLPVIQFYLQLLDKKLEKAKSAAQKRLEDIAEEMDLDLNNVADLEAALEIMEEDRQEALEGQRSAIIEALLPTIANFEGILRMEPHFAEMFRFDSYPSMISQLPQSEISANLRRLTSNQLRRLEFAVYDYVANGSTFGIEAITAEFVARSFGTKELTDLNMTANITTDKRGGALRNYYFGWLETTPLFFRRLFLNNPETDVVNYMSALGFVELRSATQRADAKHEGQMEWMIEFIREKKMDSPYAETSVQIYSLMKQKPAEMTYAEWTLSVRKQFEDAVSQDKRFNEKVLSERKKAINDAFYSGKIPRSGDAIMAHLEKNQNLLDVWAYIGQHFETQMPRVKAYAENFLGQQFVEEPFYSPIRYRKGSDNETLEKKMEETQGIRKALDSYNANKLGKRAASTFERNPQAMKSEGRYIDMDFLGTIKSVDKENEVKVATAKHIAYISEMTSEKNDAFTKSIPDEDMRRQVRQKVYDYMIDSKGTAADEMLGKSGKKFVNAVRNITVLYYFGAVLDQVIKQSAPMWNTLVEARSMTAKFEFFNSIIEYLPIAVGGGNILDPHKAQVSSFFDVQNRNVQEATLSFAGDRGMTFDKTRFEKGMQISTAGLRNTDKIVASASWFAFYTEYRLRNGGVSPADFSWEAEAANVDKKAGEWASSMVAKDQNISTSRDRSKFGRYTRGNAMGLIKLFGIPFIDFLMNKKMNMILDTQKVIKKGQTKDALLSLAGTVAEIAHFQFATWFITAPIMAALGSAIFGDDDEEKSWWSEKFNMDMFIKGMLTDVNPYLMPITAMEDGWTNLVNIGNFLAKDRKDQIIKANGGSFFDGYKAWEKVDGLPSFGGVGREDAGFLFNVFASTSVVGSIAANAYTSTKNIITLGEDIPYYTTTSGTIKYLNKAESEKMLFMEVAKAGTLAFGAATGLMAKELTGAVKAAERETTKRAVKNENSAIDRLLEERFINYFEGKSDNLDVELLISNFRDKVESDPQNAEAWANTRQKNLKTLMEHYYTKNNDNVATMRELSRRFNTGNEMALAITLIVQDMSPEDSAKFMDDAVVYLGIEGPGGAKKTLISMMIAYGDNSVMKD